MNIFTLSWKNFFSKPLNVILSLLLFSFGIGLILLLLRLSEQIQTRFEKNLANIDLVIGAKGSPLQLVLSSMYHLDSPTGNIKLNEVRAFMNPKHPLIAKAVPLLLGDNVKGYRIVGTDTSFMSLYELKLAQGQLWQAPFEVVLGATLAADLNLQLGATFYGGHGLVHDEDQLHNETTPYKVVGILAPSESVADQLAICDKSTTWLVHEQAHHDEHDENMKQDTAKELAVTSLLIRYRNKTNFQALNMPRMINQNTNMQAASPAIEMNRLYALLGVGEQGLRNLASMIILISGLSIFISLYNSLKERRYELALLRVLGASKWKIASLILLEGLWLSILGALLGIVLAHIGLYWASHVLQSNYHYTFGASWWGKYEITMVFVSIVIGFLAAIIPAVQAFRTDISKTLAGN